MLPSPCYLLYEEKLRKNLALIKGIATEADVEFILAFKAFALWKTFPIFREYIHHTTASSPGEAQLAFYEFGSRAHTYSPAYEESTFPTILACSSHITFNSLSQFTRFRVSVNAHNAVAHKVSMGIRVNPEYSEIETLIYNPCAPGSRFGVLAKDLPEKLPKELEGFHCHNHCESSAEAFVESLRHIEEKFSKWFEQIKWLNFGGGHLVTRKDYNVPLLIEALKNFKQRYPHLKIILEPGSAFAWQIGDLLAEVVDIVSNDGIKTAILNVSFACHMPDCLEMPYHPRITGAEILSEENSVGREREEGVYRIGGNSCLSGDFMGCWKFPKALSVGDSICLEDMIHYTTVKTNMFNGIHHPAIAMQHLDGAKEILREFTYEDYRNRMD